VQFTISPGVLTLNLVLEHFLACTKYVSMYVCMYVCVYVSMCVCTYICVCMFLCILYVCFYVCVYVSMYVCMYVCVISLNRLSHISDTNFYILYTGYSDRGKKFLKQLPSIYQTWNTLLKCSLMFPISHEYETY
jgi:hypothetical protein